MKKIISTIAVSLMGFGLQAAHAQNIQSTWPNKQLRFLVAAPAGSSLDVIARSMADKLSPRVGQPVVVENVAGG
ncbi:MAG: hypothetical protein RIT15_662, partial [Pseudomonadota bacterium]